MGKTTPRTAFNWADPLLLELQLTDEERMVRDSAAEFVRDALAPRVRDAFREERTDTELFLDMGEHGLLGALVPEAHGGSSLNQVACGLIAREIERVDAGYRSMFSVQSALAMLPIQLFGSEEQRERYLPRLASGAWIGSFGLSEPDGGADLESIATRASAVAGGFRISGSKEWITCSPVADIFVVWARTDDGTLRGFVLERGMQHLTTPETRGKMGLRTVATGRIVMDSVFVPGQHLLPGTSGSAGPLACLDAVRYGMAWGALGAAEACWFAARQYALDRKQFGKPLAANQLIQKKLADMQTEIALGLQGCLQLGRLRDAGRAAPEATVLLKRHAVGKALEIARAARDMLGGNGISDEFGVIRHLLDLEAASSFEGTQDVYALLLGRAQTGISALGNPDG